MGPQIKGICKKVYIIKPKKPNSALRKVVKVKIKGRKQNIIAYIPGIGHNLQEHNIVLLRGGRKKDLPGIKFTVIRGALDSNPVINRITSRSKYGVSSYKKK